MADKIWLKRALIPLWVLQLLVLLILIGSSAVGLYAVQEYNEDVDVSDNVYMAATYVFHIHDQLESS